MSRTTFRSKSAVIAIAGQGSTASARDRALASASASHRDRAEMSDTPVFTVEEIEKIADLASLELNAEEKATFARQFGNIINYFKMIDADQLSTPTAAGAAPGASEKPSTPTAPAAGPLFREDKAVASGISPEDFSPHLEAHHFKVPKVIE